MPKTKKKQKSSSSKSDSGPEDRNQPASKKAKEETPTVEADKSASKGSGGGGNWVLKKVRKVRQVRINEKRGRKIVEIGEYYEKNGEIVRAKKGISLSIQAWKALLKMADEITRAVEN